MSELEWECNDFTHSDTHIKYSGTAGPGKNPVDEKPAGNSYDANGNFLIDNATSTPLNYYSSLSSIAPSNNVNLTSPTGETDCDYDCDAFLSWFDTWKSSINDVSLPFYNLIVYPNPVEDGIFHLNLVNATDNINAEIEIFNAIGEKVSSKIITSNISNINVSALSKGTYYLRLIIDNEIYSTIVLLE